ncbi:hypothetical protein ACWD3J_15470 [Streptomyces sp. NPDC002755]
MREPVVVLAGSLAQFRYWCRSAGLDPESRHVVYASTVEKLYGMNGVRVVRYGTWRHRRDALALDNRARAIEARSG